jgi:hypothetical protein
MPTISPNPTEQSSNDLFEAVAKGDYTKLPNRADFENVLNQAVMHKACEPKASSSNTDCSYLKDKNFFIHHFLKGCLADGELNNIFDFFTNYIKANANNLPNADIEKLIFLSTHYTTMYEAKINETNNIFTDNDVITTTSFLNTLTSLLNIPNIAEFETHGLIYKKGEILPNITFGELQGIDTLVVDSIKLIVNLHVKLDYKRFIYEKESLLDLLKSLGNFGFELKIKEEFQDYSNKILEIANKTIHSTNVKNFSKEDRELAGYTFLYGFDAGNANDIESDCKSLLGFEKCPRPVTPSIRLFQRIAEGNYFNQKPPFADFALVESEINNIRTLDRDQRIHILSFLKNVLKTNNGPENKFNFKNLYTFAFENIDNLTNDLRQKNQLDLSFAEAVENLSFVLFNIVKNNVNNEDLYDQIHIITQFSTLYENIILHAPHLNSLSDTVRNHLFNILARNIDSEYALQAGHTNFFNIINNLNKVCRENRNTCNVLKISAGSFKSLGSISSKSSSYTLNATREANALIESTRGNLNPEQLRDAVAFFFRANISQADLNRKCKQLFNLTGCRPASTINLDNASYNEIDEINTTLLPEEHLIDTSNTTTTKAASIPDTTTTPAPFVLNTTLAQPIDQTTPASIIDSETPAPFDPTKTKPNDNQVSTFPSGLELGAAAAHGGITGTLNGIIQYFAAKYSRPGEQSSTTKAMVIYSSMFAHAAVSATFPLMLLQIQEYIHQGNEDEAQKMWDTLLLQALPTFISSFGLSLGLEILRTCTNLLGNLQVRAVTQNTIPLVATAWSAMKNPFATGTQIVTSMGASFFAHGVFNWISPLNRRNYQDVEDNSTEMQEFIAKKVSEPNVDAAQNINTPVNEEITSEELFSKMGYASFEKFNELIELLSTLITQIEALMKSLSDQEQIDRLQKIIQVPDSQLGLHYDLDDLNKFIGKFKQEYNLCNDNDERDKVVKKNFDYFKTTLKIAGDKISNDKVEDNECLNLIFKTMQYKTTLKDSILSSIELIKQNMQNIRTIVKPIISIHVKKDAPSTLPVKPQRLPGNKTTTIFREKKSKDIPASNRHTYHANSDSGTDTRFSIASDESSSLGNSTYNPMDRQQETRLLSPALRV